MSSRLALESWQLLFPAIGIAIFAAIFFGVVFRVWQMRPPSVGHLEHLPLENETPLPMGAGSLPAEAWVPPASPNFRSRSPGPEAPRIRAPGTASTNG